VTPKQKPKQKPKRRPSWLMVYHQESRQVGRSLAIVLPLLLGYEIAIAFLAPEIRNSAEMAVADFVRQLPHQTLMILRYTLLVGLVGGTLWWMRESRPRATVARPYLMLTEALLLAVLLGPAVEHLVGRIGLSAISVEKLPPEPVWLPFLMSVGAGLWEEIVFRLGLLGGLYVLLHRVFRMPELSSVGIGILISALAFALYHNVGASGEAFTLGRFAFRAFAGTILGVLFAWRGLAIVVYMHVFYDVLCDLRIALI
jgi:membrane protease YdiL (CAAX protease family)